MSEEMKCKNCKYHYIEELTFDYPQSCCRKRSETTEQWCKCNDFEYGDRYIENLQQENNQLKERIDKVLKLANTILNLPEDKFCKYDTYLNSINEILEILKGDNQ